VRKVLALVIAGVLGLLAPAARADEVLLVNGDRITGKVIGKVTRRVRLQTPYGTLLIPRSKVERIRHDDGTEELVHVAPTPAPTPTPPPRATLRIEVGGASFWRAWDPSAAPEDPSLRLQLRLDGRVVASYTDNTLDPEDLPKAVVNSFVFSPERLIVAAAEGVIVAPVEVAEGTIRLGLELPAELFGPRNLRLAYQVNDGSSAAPVWWDVVAAECPVTLAAGAETTLRLVQERGAMQYTRRHMRNEETFHATFELASPSP
jgi:hypothetical protein